MKVLKALAVVLSLALVGCVSQLQLKHALDDVREDNRQAIIENSLPVGSIIYLAEKFDVSDERLNQMGYLIPDGRTVSKTKYPVLFDAIGYYFGGSGDNFNLPSLRGRFIRGWDNTGKIDPAREFGSTQEDAFQEHKHFLQYRTKHNINNGDPTPHGSDVSDPYLNKGATREPSTGRYSKETRPKNIALLPVIKFR